MKTLAALRETDEPFIGEKAAALSRLARAGFPVPETLVLDSRDIANFTRGVPPPDVAAGISRCAGAFRARGYANLVIRNSPLPSKNGVETSSNISKAISNVPVHDFAAILAAIRKCTDAQKALMIQAMIQGEVSGTLFTIDPLRGAPTTHLIKTTKAGRDLPTQYTYDWQENLPSPEMRGPLKLDQIRALSRLALDVQREYGCPLELEWTIRSGKIYLLQARPITHPSFPVTDDWLSARINEGGTTPSLPYPLVTSQFQMMMKRTIPEYFTGLRISPHGFHGEWTALFYGQLYLNLSAIKLAVKQIPGFIEREFDQGLGLSPNYSGPGESTKLTPKSFFQGFRIRSALKRSLRNRLTTGEAATEHADQIFTELTSEKIRSLSDQDLAERASRLIETDWFIIAGEDFRYQYDLWWSKSLGTQTSDPILLKQSETVRIRSKRMLDLIQAVFLELGRRLVARGKLSKPDDLLFLEYPEALALYRGEKTEVLRARLEKNRAFYESYRNFATPNVIRKALTGAPSPTRIRIRKDGANGQVSILPPGPTGP